MSLRLSTSGSACVASSNAHSERASAAEVDSSSASTPITLPDVAPQMQRGVFFGGGNHGAQLAQPFEQRAGHVVLVDGLPELRWLATTFGALTLMAEQSGTGIFGKRLSHVHAGSGIWDLVRAEQPPGYERWLSLYEIDGDWLMFDPPTHSVR